MCYIPGQIVYYLQTDTIPLTRLISELNICGEIEAVEIDSILVCADLTEACVPRRKRATFRRKIHEFRDDATWPPTRRTRWDSPYFVLLDQQPDRAASSLMGGLARGGGALQATPGASASLGLAYLSYELFEKRFLRLKRLFETTKESAPRRAAVDGAAGS